MVQQYIDKSICGASSFGPDSCVAAQMGPLQRRELFLAALRRREPLLRLAERHRVSRKFVYRQMAKATAAVDQAFQAPASPEDKVLFRLPVTQPWLEQLVLSLTLICHSSYRGVMELLETMFNYRDISLGRIHNLLMQAVDKARQVNAAEDLSAIRVGAHDEIYQARQPVLVGMDVDSTYCYLLQAVEHCDETSWGVHLLAFVEVLQEHLAQVAQRFAVPLATVQGLCEVEALDKRSDRYWQRTAQWQSLLKQRWYPIHEAVLEAMARTPRASSIVENLNRRLRGYFFLRHQIGHGYLDLRRFFLNHRRFLRSDRPERVDKSPAELLTGQSHPHWLQFLGYTRFRHN